MATAKKRERKTKPILLIMKFFYYLFVCSCFAVLFALFTILVEKLIIGNVENVSEIVKVILLSIIVLIVLFFINRESVKKGFEYIAFGKVRGIPIGMVIIGLFLYTIFDSLVVLLFDIQGNTFIKIVNFAISLVISVALYSLLSFWYFDRKEGG